MYVVLLQKRFALCKPVCLPQVGRQGRQVPRGLLFSASKKEVAEGIGVVNASGQHTLVYHPKLWDKQATCVTSDGQLRTSISGQQA